VSVVNEASDSWITGRSGGPRSADLIGKGPVVAGRCNYTNTNIRILQMLILGGSKICKI
jgi:hypothetical protein